MSDKKNSLDLNNHNNTPRLKKKSSYDVSNINHGIDATELPINDQKNQKSFSSFLSANRSDESSKSSLSSVISNLFKKNSQSHIQSMIIQPIDEDIQDDQDEKFATHVSISPNGRYICTFNCKKLEFKIFESEQFINYFNISVTAGSGDKFVKIPKISSSSDDDTAPYRIEYGALHEYMNTLKINEHYGSEKIPKESNSNTENLENHLNEKSDKISLENIKKEESRENCKQESTSRKFPSWSLAISNMMEHQGEHVIFVAISAVVEADMKKKISEEEEEEINRLYPNRNRYNNDEYAIDFVNQDPTEDDSDNLDDFENIKLSDEFTNGRTAIYRIVLKDNNLIQKPSRITQYNSHNVAGIIMFIKEESNNPYVQDSERTEQNYLIETLATTSCIIINAEGIFKVNYSVTNVKFKEEKFSFPRRMEKELKSWYRSKHCMDRLLSCIYHHYFFVDQYKDGVHTIEMYNLSTMEQEQIFIIRHEENVSHSANNVSSVFAISQNKQLIACSNGERSVTLFWIENGLDIGVKEFGVETRILFLEFINNDEKLLIITEETCIDIKDDSKAENHDKLNMIVENSGNKQKQMENGKLFVIMEEGRKNLDDKHGHVKLFPEEKEKVVNDDNLLKPRIPRRSSCKDVTESVVTKVRVWDLFSSADDAVRIGMSGDLFPSKENYHSHMARIPGSLYHMKEDGSVFSILEHDGFVNLINGEETDSTLSFGCTLFTNFEVQKNMPYVFANDDDDDDVKSHKVFCRKERKKSGIHKVIVNNKEPWIYMSEYNRTSIYLDGEETIQLIIGHSTVQIWRKSLKQKKSDKKGAVSQKQEPVLEYIWANNILTEYDIENSKLIIKDLWVGDCAFSLEVYWQYNEGNKLCKRTERLLFPCTDGHVTPILYACKALEHLNNRKNKIIDYKKMLEFEQLVENTNRIVWRFVKKKPEVFKLIDVRYGVMSNLIRGGCNYLIKFILFGEISFEELKAEKKLLKKMKKEHENKYKYQKQVLHIPKSKQWISVTEQPQQIEVKFESKTFLFQLFSFIRKIMLWFCTLMTFKKKEKEKKTKRKYNKIIKPCTDLEWAIEYCKDKERKDAVMVGYLLEYYSENALHHIGWMMTISKALPFLYKYNLVSQEEIGHKILKLLNPLLNWFQTKIISQHFKLYLNF
ncbi:hypothetical protein C1645_357996 [Glomus cerebriforme]|uniref:Uncharacterized protein n=1 Tax=Glomus cerebriforme TaxID=658196 RepID=A0A397TSP7_9GLOM|nr:hypothetical protein C1645_357996 [Glomus cerebriforme]